MTRRVSLSLVVMMLCCGTAFAKISKNDKDYIDDKIADVNMSIKALQNQIAALRVQMEALGKQLALLQTTQQALSEDSKHQANSMTDIYTTINSMRASHAADLGTIKDVMNVLLTQMSGLSKQVNALAAQGATAAPVTAATIAPATGSTLAAAVVPASATTPAAAAPVAAPPAQPAAPAVTEGNVTLVEGSKISVDLGSAQNLHPGSKLSLFKAQDPAARVGELEVTDIVDSSNCHARIASLITGAQPEAGDVVRPE
jgi:peptidoglycan hydrolase CwlO-like protein